jgi:hypothetical protein
LDLQWSPESLSAGLLPDEKKYGRDGEGWAGLGEMIANSFYWTGPTDAQVLKAGVLVLVGIA